MSPATLAAIRTTSRVGKVKVLGYNGSLFALQYIQSPSNSKIMVVDADESTDWIAYANMDQTFRILADMPIIAERTPTHLFDKSDIANAETPPSLTKGY